MSKARAVMQTRQKTSVLGLLVMLLSVAGCQPPGKPPLEEPSPETVMNFQALYSQDCQACHGADGKNGPARILNDPLYLAILPKEELRSVIENGRTGTSMPAWAVKEGGPLYPKQIDALVNGIESNWAKPVDFHGAPAPSYAGTGLSGDASNGMKLFVRDCYMCHGPGARIGPVTDPAFLSLITDQCLRTSILVGRPDYGMPDYRFLGLGHPLSDQDVADIVAYLSSKRPADAAAAFENAQTSKPQPTGGDGKKNSGAGKALR